MLHGMLYRPHNTRFITHINPVFVPLSSDHLGSCVTNFAMFAVDSEEIIAFHFSTELASFLCDELFILQYLLLKCLDYFMKRLSLP